METFIPTVEKFGDYRTNPEIVNVLERQRAKLGDMTPLEAKAALRAECFPGENPTA